MLSDGQVEHGLARSEPYPSVLHGSKIEDPDAAIEEGDFAHVLARPG